MMYVIEGPVTIGNRFGYAGRCEIATGEYAIVEDGEYCNGGRGPSTIDGVRYKSYAAAITAMGASHE